MKNKSKKRNFSLMKWIILGFTLSAVVISLGTTLVFSLAPNLIYKPDQKYIPKDNEYIEFNAKINKDGTINNNYNPKYLTIRQWAYSEDENKNPKYFLDNEGMEKLAKAFFKKGGFGPETNELIRININKTNIPNVHHQNASGLFVGLYEQIYLSLDSFIYDSNKNLKKLKKPWYNVDNSIKIELILPTLIHEYMHHVANIYSQSMIINNNYQDEFATDEIIDNFRIAKYKADSLPKEQKKEYGRSINNKKFLNDFKEALLFNLENKKYKKNYINPFSQGIVPIYHEYSAAELFNIANYLQKDNNVWKQKKYTFNHDKQQWIQYVNNVTENGLNYYFSFEELIPREFLKLSYIPKEHYKNASSVNGGYFGFDNQYGAPFISSYTEDISHIMALHPVFNGQDVFIYDETLYGANWVFDNSFFNVFDLAITDETDIDELLNNLTNKNWKTKKRQQLLYKSYLDLLGYGLPISIISSNNNYLDLMSEHNSKIDSSVVTKAAQKAYKSLSFGGYINYMDAFNKSKNTFRKTFFENNHLIIKNNGKQNILNIKINVGNLRTKSKWTNSEAEKGQDLGPEFVNLDSHYFSYFTNDYLDIKNIDINKPLEISFWEDKNKDNKIQDDEITLINNEIAFQRYKEIKRRITNYRRSLAIYNITNNIQTYCLEYDFEPELPKDKQFTIKLKYYGNS